MEMNEVVEAIEVNSEVSDVLVALENEDSKKSQITNKRVDFDKKTMRRIETMLPIYREEVGESFSTSELFSYVIQKAVNSLFEGDFKKKLDEL